MLGQVLQHLLWGGQKLETQLAMKAVKVRGGNVLAEVAVDVAHAAELLAAYIARAGFAFPHSSHWWGLTPVSFPKNHFACFA